MRNKKVLKLFMVISLVFTLILTSNFLACVQQPEPEVVAEIPMPWQSWVIIGGDMVVDIIVLPEEYTQTVSITRQWVTLNGSIELDDLTWNQTEEIVMGSVGNWTGSDAVPETLVSGSEVTLNISVTQADAAVVVRYSVELAAEIVVYVINEVLVQWVGGNATIIGSLSNFDVHNDTNEEVDNLELALYGNITDEDIVGWYDTPGAWGIPAEVTTLVGDGIEIMWQDVENPIPSCTWKHFGVRFAGDIGQLEGRAFWTKTS